MPSLNQYSALGQASVLCRLCWTTWNDDRRLISRGRLADDGEAIHDAADLIEAAESIVEGVRWDTLVES